MQLMTMTEAVDFIEARPRSTANHSLDKIRMLMGHFDNPQDKIKVIHLAGTNGKGSTARMLASVFGSSFKTGLFTSPYIRKINENISINGISISNDDFASYITRLKDLILDLDEHGQFLTYFEVMTALMYLYFYEQGVDIAIVETGLGGLLDSTNIIKNPIATVITTISMDHVNILGGTLEEIAYQKAGIIKENSPVFIYPQESNIMQVFYKKARELTSPIYTFSKDEIIIKSSDEYENIFDFRDYEDNIIKLAGIHQVYNASLAISVLDYFKDQFDFDKQQIKENLAKATNIGRLSIISTKPRVLVDGSHNRESIDAMVEALKTFSYDKLIVGFSVLEDKDYEYIIARLSQIADTLIVTSLDGYRSFDFDLLTRITREKYADVIAIKDRTDAYDYAKSLAAPNDLILWCGSLYLIAEYVNYEGV